MKQRLTFVFVCLFLLVLAGCAGEEAREPVEVETKWDLIPTVMVDGTLYVDTGRKDTAEGRCGVMDGEITSEVEGSELPSIDDQSNFGTGFGYQYGKLEGTLALYIEDSWYIFAEEAVKQAMP